MASEITLVQQQLCGSGAAFSVKYIGLIEVVTPAHVFKASEETKFEIAHGCASLIAHAAGLISEANVTPEIQELIGNNPPKVINKDVELTITNKSVTLFSGQKLLRRIDISNISISVTVESTLENGLIFIGKVKVPATNEMKRFCFLQQSGESPENIHSTFKVAFLLAGQMPVVEATSTIIMDKDSNQMTDDGFKRPLPRQKPQSKIQDDERDLFYLNVTEKPGDASPRISRKLEKPNRELDSDVKTYQGPFPDVSIVAKRFKISDNHHWMPNNDERNLDIDKNNGRELGDLARISTETSSAYSNIFDDDFAGRFPTDSTTLLHTKCTAKRFEEICQGLHDQLWFFGKIKRDVVPKYVKHDGDFLVRIAETRDYTVVLTARNENKLHHIMLNDVNGNVTSMNNRYDSILHLMSYHFRTGESFCGDNGTKVYIRNPVSRPTKL